MVKDVNLDFASMTNWWRLAPDWTGRRGTAPLSVIDKWMRDAVIDALLANQT